MSRSTALKTAARGTVVNLDDYRRTRGERRATGAPMRSSMATPVQVALSPVWVYWVPVWVW